MIETRRTTIPIEFIKLDDEGVHLLINAKIKRTNIYLLIDTGASKSVYDETLLSGLIEEIDEESEINSTGISSKQITSRKAIINKFRIGKFLFNEQEIILMDLSHINNMYSQFTDKKIWGLLGGDFLTKYKATINYRSKSLSINKEVIKE